MYETVKQIDETDKKTRQILDLLNYRGKKGVSALHDAFLESNNEELAKALAPYVIEVEKKRQQDRTIKMASNKLENEDMLKDKVIKIKDPKSPWCIHDYGKDHAYTIQNEEFNIIVLELHFTVFQEQDLTAKGMQSFLQNSAEQLQKDEISAECACRSVETASIDKTVHLVKPGEQIEIECIVKSSKSIQNVYWEWDNLETKVKKRDFYRITEWSNSNKYRLQQMKSVRSLFVKNVSENDKGKYRCIIKHDDKSVSVSNFTELQLDIKEKSNSELPKVFEKLSTAGRDEIDSVPSVQETQHKCSQQSTFLDHPNADF
ncbi:PTPRM [Mytilus edulis]|uniref:PTPRM n=1 Tax=Mytilus edulis TaxID=6550 RepID=A0A8S3QYY8_MYTED|nr:PTPRM [Mytilus edulis]